MIDELLIKLAQGKSKKVTDSDVIPFNDKIHLHKVAWDLYKIDNDPYEHLWRLDEEDGKKVLVRASDPQYETKERGDWSAISDADQKNVTLAYKNVPISRFSSNTFKFTPKDILTFRNALLDRIEQDRSFIKDLLSEQPSSKKEAIVDTFPELKKYL